MALSDIADRVTRGFERTGASVSGAFEPVVRLGVTGLARSGKTVFITSLVSNLLEQGRMALLTGAPRIQAAYLQPQPDDTVPRFDYEGHLAALTGVPAKWPLSTKSVSELRVSLKVQPGGFLSGLRSPRVVHIDIVDYPGEWLLDLTLLDRSYDEWSMLVLGRLAKRREADAFLTALPDSAATFDETRLRDLSEVYVSALQALRDAGYSDCTPGRFLMPGELAGSPALTFVPLAKNERVGRASLWRECERRYEAYRKQIVKPFYRDHFAKIDRQIVLVDVLGALHAGPDAFDNLRLVMADVMKAFRPGRNGFFSEMFLGRRVEKLLFAATKADHLHHRQHAKLQALTEALLAEARQRASFAGAQTQAVALASLRATVEAKVDHKGDGLDLVQGYKTGKVMAFHA
ncbi:MAG: YcjX family protein, partial [Deltaproteobacteria bacterium]